GRARHAARKVDHVAERELGDRLHETGASARHQDADGGGRRHVDVADVDRAAHEGAQAWQFWKYLARSLRHAVRDDDIDIAPRIDQGGTIEPHIALRQFSLGPRAQTAEAALAVIVAPHLRCMGQQYFQGGYSFDNPSDHQRARRSSAAAATLASAKTLRHPLAL